MRVEARADGWFIEGGRMPGIDPGQVPAFRARGAWAQRTLGDIIAQSAAIWPNRIALVVEGRRVSYRELDAMSSRLALGFLENGIGPGDMVAVQLPNGIAHAAVVYALGKIGAVCNLIVPIMRAKEVSFILNHCRSKALVVPGEYGKFDYLRMAEEVAGGAPALRTIFVAGNDVRERDGVVALGRLMEGPRGDHAGDRLASLRPSPDAPSLVGFTSGTTAQPKAYVHTHNTEYANAWNCMLADGYNELARPGVSIALPGFAWMYGRWCGLFASTLAGVTNIIVDPFTPEAVMATIAAENPTHLHGAPAIYRSLLDGLRTLPPIGESPLSVFHYAGSTMPWEMGRQLRAHAHVLTCYGLSEISPVCGTTIHDDAETQIRSSGRAWPGNEVWIGDENSRPLGVEEEGEIHVRGPGLTLGYLRQEAANDSAFPEPGLFRTGDLGYMDATGRLHITGRSKDVIDRGGIKFSPREVEEMLLTYPGIRSVAVVGMPDPRLGERSCAFVVLEKQSGAVHLPAVVEFLRAQGLATHKLPERLETIDELPTTMTGKVQKYLLRQQIAAQIKEG